MRVLVVDYGMGNLASARRALELCDADVTVTDDPGALAIADKIVVPGVGSFSDGMAHLRARGWPDALRAALDNPRVHLLGICLGMQLLAERGTEGGDTEGLRLIPGEVRRLEPTDATERIPHVGWNELHPVGGDPLFAEIAPGTDFYFVHSYHLVPSDAAHVRGTTPYAGGFVSAVARDNVHGVQFHPEKSAAAGRQVLLDFLALPC